jgi:hypothetical protein
MGSSHGNIVSSAHIEIKCKVSIVEMKAHLRWESNAQD